MVITDYNQNTRHNKWLKLCELEELRTLHIRTKVRPLCNYYELDKEIAFMKHYIANNLNTVHPEISLEFNATS